MKIPEFVATLLPSFERKRLTALIASTRTHINDNLIPTYENAVEALGNRPLQSTPGKALSAMVADIVHTRFDGNALAGILFVLRKLPETLDYLDHEVTREFSGEVARDSLTYRQVTLLQMISSLDFFSEFSGIILDRTLAAEVAVAQGRENEVDQHLLPAVKRYLTEKMAHYAEALSVAQISVGTLRSDLDKIPQLTVVPENTANVEATVGANKLDPLKFSLFGLGTNPFYFLGKWYAEYQVGKFRAAEEELKTTQLRLMSLRQAQEGKRDAGLERQIAYNQDRTEGLTRKLEQMKADWS